MGPPPRLRLSDSSVKSLIVQCRSSSSPCSSVDSPTDSSLCLSISSSLPPSSISYFDPSLPSVSSSSSSSTLVPEIVFLPENNGPLRPRKKKCKGHGISERSAKEESQHVTSHTPRRASADTRRKRKGCQENVCIKCAAGITADCAALCCCPLALLHLAALAFIRLPAAVAWKLLVSLKNKIYRKRQSAKDGHEDSPSPHYDNPWSYGGSPEGRTEPCPVTDSQNLWQHFEGRNLDFGELSMRRDPG